MGFLGLVCDCFDGAIARKLKVATDYGSLLDWSVDMMLCAIAVSRVMPPKLAIFALVAALPAQVALRLTGTHFCGRALVFVAMIAWELLR